ncbi:MAG TPA: YifB family Mg chelatase-like AAA ATPase [Mycobacteriales bacterium]|nr:YifB family Mg chelatase-like AAA ATPase [Mycobacteriales bacterium]
MAIATSYAVALVGIDGKLVEVQADLASGIPGLSITGLPDTALYEARDRVKAAVVNSGVEWPQKRITLGLSPAALPKKGSGFDLALAAALLAAAGVVPTAALRGRVLLGELGLDGRVRAVPGILPALHAARELGWRRFVVPVANLLEARILDDVDVVGVARLSEVIAVLRGVELPEPELEVTHTSREPDRRDFADVLGQPVGRIACEVAAAGGHNLLMTGPPGCGKTLLAERLPALLPDLSREDALQVTAVHSVAGRLPADASLITRPPYQAPHHGATPASVVGGGSGLAKPGAASLAHKGVLFLDEAPEFQRTVLDALRQPLESGEITIQRVGGTACYPARFALVMAANPCPCAKPESRCTCRPMQRQGYLAKLSGPLLDRVDINVSLMAITRREIQADNGSEETTAVIAARVGEARRRAARRFAQTPWRTNAEVPVTELTKHWPLQAQPLAMIGGAMDRGLLTARGFGRVQRLAWTLADLMEHDRPVTADVELALSLRLGDRWAPGGSSALGLVSA